MNIPWNFSAFPTVMPSSRDIPFCFFMVWQVPAFIINLTLRVFVASFLILLQSLATLIGQSEYSCASDAFRTISKAGNLHSEDIFLDLLRHSR